MGCKFCASTIGGLVRNLSASEMLEQIYFIQKEIGERVSNVVVMGTGEPLDNYESLISFVKIISDKNGINISQRNITVSTCGLVNEIHKLADEDLNITLAISLHAPNDSIRREIMPIANKYKIEEILNECRYYIIKTKRRISFEYSLIDAINDEEIHAIELSKILRGINCHVNLIPVNSIEERNYRKSNNDKIIIFKKVLTNHGINVTIRRELGSDIQAACGQLRKSYLL